MEYTGPNRIIEEIRTTNSNKIMDLAQERKKILRGPFIENGTGLPTEAYKTFLLRIVELLPTFTMEEYAKIKQFLFTSEEERLTGMMVVHPTHPKYNMYYRTAQAIFGDNNIPGMSVDGTMEISNTNVVIMISKLEEGCEYHPCKRKNPLHIKLMHPTVEPNVNEKKKGGKRSIRSVRKTRKQGIRKRSTRKRSTLKRTMRRTHKN